MNKEEDKIETFPKVLSGDGVRLVIDREECESGAPLFMTTLTDKNNEVILDGAFDTYEDSIAFYTNLSATLSAIFG